MAATQLRCDGLECSSAVTEWFCQKRSAHLTEQTVKRHKGGGRVTGETSNAALRGVQSHLQCIEVGHLTDLDNELTIDDKGIEPHRAKIDHDLREKPRQR